MKVELLTANTFEKFHGKRPPINVKGVAVTHEDEVFGVCCISRIEGSNFVICGTKPGVGKRAIIKGWVIFSQMLQKELTYYALVDRDLPSAPGFLKHFGFEPFEDDIYVYRGK